MLDFVYVHWVWVVVAFIAGLMIGGGVYLWKNPDIADQVRYPPRPARPTKEEPPLINEEQVQVDALGELN